MGFIAKQPNGLYCRFSTIIDCPTHHNMTKDEYINFRMEIAREEAEHLLNNSLQPFEEVIDSFIPNNMTEEEFEQMIKEMEKTST